MNEPSEDKPDLVWAIIKYKGTTTRVAVEILRWDKWHGITKMRFRGSRGDKED